MAGVGLVSSSAMKFTALLCTLCSESSSCWAVRKWRQDRDERSGKKPACLSWRGSHRLPSGGLYCLVAGTRIANRAGSGIGQPIVGGRAGSVPSDYLDQLLDIGNRLEWKAPPRFARRLLDSGWLVLPFRAFLQNSPTLVLLAVAFVTSFARASAGHRPRSKCSVRPHQTRRCYGAGYSPSP